MDLWDLTKVLVRRWYVSVPLFLASVVIVLVTAMGVSPDYTASGNITMIPSSGQPAAPGKPRPANPWNALGLEALANAAALKITDPANLQHLADQGFAESITVSMPNDLPMLLVEVVGDTPEQATATVREVIRLLVEDVKAEQKQFGVASDDMITTLVLNDGAQPEVETSKVKRLVAVAATLALLLTAGATVLFDALSRRRARRRGGAGGLGFAGSTASRRRGASNMPPQAPLAPQSPAIHPPSLSVDFGRRQQSAHHPGPTPHAFASSTSAAAGPPRSGEAASPENADSPTEVALDATIVLPLTHPHGWAGRDKRA